MTILFNIQNLKDLAIRTNALFLQDSPHKIRLVYQVNKINYTIMYFGSNENGFKQYNN